MCAMCNDEVSSESPSVNQAYWSDESVSAGFEDTYYTSSPGMYCNPSQAIVSFKALNLVGWWHSSEVAGNELSKPSLIQAMQA